MVGLMIFGFVCTILGICYIIRDWKTTADRKQDEPYILFVIGLALFALAGVNVAGSYSEETRLNLLKLIEYVTALIIAAVGFYVCVIVDYKKKREMVYCHAVMGRIIDYKEVSKSNSRGRKITMYAPIYEYSKNGEMVRMKSEVCGTSPRYRQIGRPVTLIINDINDRGYCLDDWETQKKKGMYMMACGTIFLVLRILS